MADEQISDAVGLNTQSAPSLVDVLCKLAENWVRCECGVEIGRAGLDGWEEKGLQLGEKIDLLNVQIPLIESPTKKALFEAELEQLEAEAEALNEEWGKACDEANACCELFWNARKFWTRACGFGDNELFNAALVGFDPERLKPGQGPSNHRMSKISSRLTNLHRDK